MAATGQSPKAGVQTFLEHKKETPQTNIQICAKSCSCRQHVHMVPLVFVNCDAASAEANFSLFMLRKWQLTDNQRYRSAVCVEEFSLSCNVTWSSHHLMQTCTDFALPHKKGRGSTSRLTAPQTEAWRDSPLVFWYIFKWFTCQVQEVGVGAVWSWCFCPVWFDSSSSWWSLWDVCWKTPERQNEAQKTRICQSGVNREKVKVERDFTLQECLIRKCVRGETGCQCVGKDEEEADSEEKEQKAVLRRIMSADHPSVWCWTLRRRRKK